jgi:hypothetical protein
MRKQVEPAGDRVRSCMTCIHCDARENTSYVPTAGIAGGDDKVFYYCVISAPSADRAGRALWPTVKPSNWCSSWT